MFDNYLNPFKSATFEAQSSQIKSTSAITLGHRKYEHKIRLDVVKQINQRIRYTLWDALADIGGFYDGLHIMIGSVLTSVAATLYSNEISSQHR